MFLRNYLEAMRRIDIWEALEAYNRAVLASVRESEKMEAERAASESRWVTAGILPECARRAANRLETAQAWDSGESAKALAFVFLQRLDCKLNARGNATALELVHELYDEASSETKSVKVRAE